MAKVPLHDIGLDHAFNGLDVAEDDDKLVIALDFGTTFSGIAYSFTGSAQPDPKSINEWPGTEGRTVPKTPTIICYDAQDRSSFSWGSKVEPTNIEKLEGIKLLLDPDQPTPLFISPEGTKRALLKLGKPPVDIASDYIGAIYKHGLEQIKASVPDDYLDMQQKKYVLTVPAVWSDKAKDLTLRVGSFSDAPDSGSLRYS
jgi:molecular chaperone DnaK (HSP70)